MEHDDLSRRGFLGTGLAGGVLAAADLTWPTWRAVARPPRMLPTVVPAGG